MLIGCSQNPSSPDQLLLHSEISAFFHILLVKFLQVFSKYLQHNALNYEVEKQDLGNSHLKIEEKP